MYTIKITRHQQNENQTIGSLDLFNNDNELLFSCVTLERGWNDNERNISCVPKGEYKAVFEYSNKFKTSLWELKNVPNRSECKFHSSNYWYQLNGCIALGLQVLDINNDNFTDVTRSKPTMEVFHEILRYENTINVIITNSNNNK